MRTTTFDPADPQADLFGTPQPAIDGFALRLDYLDADEEAALIETIATLPLHEARYKGYTARRRVASYGTQYDFDANELQRGAPLPESLHALRRKAAAWLDVAPEAFSNALVAEYRPGTPLGWHRDVPDFEQIVGVSLLAPARMRLRRYPPAPAHVREVLAIELPPRSAYVLQREARWRWQHSIAPTAALRYSITFRTPASRPPRGEPRSA